MEQSLRFCFKKKQRIFKPAIFQKVLKHPQFVYKQKNIIGLATNSEQLLTNARLGIIAAKRKFPHAKDRNKIKRIVRESFRLNQNLLINLDIIIIARGSFTLDNSKDLFNQLDKIWQNLYAFA